MNKVNRAGWQGLLLIVCFLPTFPHHAHLPFGCSVWPLLPFAVENITLTLNFATRTRHHSRTETLSYSSRSYNQSCHVVQTNEIFLLLHIFSAREVTIVSTWWPGSSSINSREKGRQTPVNPTDDARGQRVGARRTVYHHGQILIADWPRHRPNRTELLDWRLLQPQMCWQP
jgi:hypothetical protein